MTRTPGTEQAPLLNSAHRVVRVLDDGDGPFRGALVTDGDAVVVALDAAALSGWVAWRFAGSEHVAAPLDLIRRTEGHDVLLPWCTERVGVFLARRTGAGEPLAPGEGSTLVVSLLRALTELGANDCTDVDGAWWLTDAGRPVFVIGEGEQARTGVASLLARLAEQNRDRTLGRLLAAMHAGLVRSIAEQPGIAPLLLERWEKEMLEIATPRPLRREALAPEPVRVVTRPGVADPMPVPPRRASRRVRARSGARAHPSGLLTTFREHASDRCAGAGRLIARVARRRNRTTAAVVPVDLQGRSADTVPARSGRRRPLIFAGAAAAAVLAVGVLWPSGEDGGAEGNDRMPAPTSAAEVADPPVATPAPTHAAVDETVPESGERTEGGEKTAEDPVQAAAVLWTEIEGCRKEQDAVCEGAIVPGAVGVVDALGEASKTPPVFAVIDQYGDIAVVRAEQKGVEQPEGSGAEEGAAASGKVLVLARLNEKWLVRDVYDVADQPR